MLDSWIVNAETYNLILQVFSIDLKISMIVVRICVVLATFVSVTAIANYLFDEDFSQNRLLWLKNKFDDWFSLATIYSALLTPSYQKWRIVVDDEKIFHSWIVMKPNATETETQDACKSEAENARETTYLHMIYAFAHNPNIIDYKLGIQGEKHRYLVNKSKNIENFDDFSLNLTELRYKHYLGIENPGNIPDEWFGDNQDSIDLAKSVWELDKNHTYILHSHAVVSETSIGMEIFLQKRFSNSEEYKRFFSEVVLKVFGFGYVDQIINIGFQLLDSYDPDSLLASIFYSPKDTLLTYKDEYSDQVSKIINIKNFLDLD